jgi:ribosomal protein S17E
MKKKKMVNDILDFDDERNELSGQGAKRTAEERKKLFDDYMKKDFDTIKKSWDSVQKDRAKMIEAKAKAMAKLQQKAA